MEEKMLQQEMSASVRKDFGKGAMRRLRMAGNTPAVLYGTGREALSLQLETLPLVKQLLKIQRRNAVITLNIEGDSSRHVLIKELQTDPVRDTLIHADFYEIPLDKVRKFTVSLVVTGAAKGVDVGGILEVVSNKVIVEGNPLDIPDTIEVDVTELAIGDNFTVSNLVFPDTLKMLTSGDAVCVTIQAPSAA
ncbi:MAG: 50S ribosomal protein L25 [Desulfocapsaceae bacterium]|jgi:large subunit ribosomal protein L25|nr:50S ribosomal protein L25 [Desulfocapsaceae bacterium]